MKKSLLLSLLFSSAIFAGSVPETLTISEVLTVLDKVYQEQPELFKGAKLGQELAETPAEPIDQENIIAELERNLEQDEGFCEYRTVTESYENFQIIKESMEPRAARIFRKLRTEGHIAHTSSRVLTYEKEAGTCVKKQIMMVLADSSLVWLDY